MGAFQLEFSCTSGFEADLDRFTSGNLNAALCDSTLIIRCNRDSCKKGRRAKTMAPARYIVQTQDIIFASLQLDGFWRKGKTGKFHVHCPRGRNRLS